MIETFALDYITAAVFVLTFALTMGAYAIATSRRVGGLTFWRIGRIGGSVYVATRRAA